ncbi:MAG: tetratricopeptide repeat protein [Dehalococcoidia bacterium]
MRQAHAYDNWRIGHPVTWLFVAIAALVTQLRLGPFIEANLPMMLRIDLVAVIAVLLIRRSFALLGQSVSVAMSVLLAIVIVHGCLATIENPHRLDLALIIAVITLAVLIRGTLARPGGSVAAHGVYGLIREGECRYQRGDLQAGAERYRRALVLAQAIFTGKGDCVPLVRSQIAIGHAHVWQRAYPLAAEVYRDAEVTARQADDRAGQWTAVANLAAVFLNMGRLDRAMELSRQGVALAEDLGQREPERHSLDLIGSVHLAKHEYQEALVAFESALQVARTLGTRADLSSALNSLATAHDAAGDSHVALRLFEEALPVAHDVGRSSEMLVLAGIAVVHIGESHFAEALEAAQQALELARVTGNWLEEARGLGILGVVHELGGELNAALEYYRASIALQEVQPIPARMSHFAVSHREPDFTVYQRRSCSSCASIAQAKRLTSASGHEPVPSWNGSILRNRSRRQVLFPCC